MSSSGLPEDFLRQWKEAQGQYASMDEPDSADRRSDDAHDLTEDEAAEHLANGWERLHEVVPRFNLAVLGNTGAGKSSLVNAIFGEIRAEVGVGAPVTQEVTAHDNEAGTLRLYDFPGFELGKNGRDPVTIIKDELSTIQKGPEEDRIHLAWFCWDQGPRRVEDAHRAAIAELEARKVPVIAVVTKVRDDELAEIEEFGRWIRNHVAGLWSHDTGSPIVCLTRSKAPSAGLVQLLDESRTAADATFRDAIDAAQKLDAAAKRRAARGLIAAAAGSAAAAAAIPVPVATAAVLAPIQLGMMGQIARMYGLNLKGVLGGGTALLQLALQLTGRAAVASLVKVVPGAGSVINAAVASAWTYAAGEAWLYLCDGIASRKIDPDQVGPVFDYLQPIIEAVLKSKFPKS
ncbi:GTPase [Isoptericola sp. b408]|uniref:GTPase n=1 Tax=Isoptericola sp. b408 TaxID=3064653 RepID=UPI0027126D7D|nr:GTPase [Isoptericola sp. b408]MDO8150187.1 GTPase [Isoptericola sp. b408]